MTDYIGQPINIGDTVAWGSMHYAGFVLARVIRFTPKRIVLETPKRIRKETCVDPADVVNITKNLKDIE